MWSNALEDLEITEKDLEEYYSNRINTYLANVDIDTVEELMLTNTSSLVDFTLKHTFINNMYIREISMPSGSFATSRIHNTEHPFSILKGKVLVFTPDGGTEEFSAGHSGITKKGTRRALFIEEDCIWATYHVLSNDEELCRQNNVEDEELIKKVGERILHKRELFDTGKTSFEIYSEKLGETK